MNGLGGTLLYYIWCDTTVLYFIKLDNGKFLYKQRLQECRPISFYNNAKKQDVEYFNTISHMVLPPCLPQT